MYGVLKGHRSLMVTVARICKSPRFATASGHLVFDVLSVAETELLLVVKLGCNVVMMRAGVKVMRDARKTTA